MEIEKKYLLIDAALTSSKDAVNQEYNWINM